MGSTRLKRNISYNFAYQVLILILPLITAPYLARVVGAEGVGIYSYSYSIATCFTYITMLGLNNYGNRAIASCGESKVRLTHTFWAIYAMQVVCFILAAAGYAFYVGYFAYDKTAAAMQSLFVLSSLLDINWFFFGIERFQLTVFRNAVVKIATVFFIFVFVKTPADVNTYILIMSGGFLLSQLCLWPFLPRYIGFRRPQWQDIVAHIRPNALLFVPVVAISIYNLISKIILGSLAGNAALGFYENAAKIEAVPLALIAAVGTVMMPRTTALLLSGETRSSDLYREKTLVFIMAFSTMATFGIPAIATPFINIFYGRGFEESAQVLSILCINVFVSGFGNVVRTQYIIPKGRDSIFAWSAVLGAVASVSLNLILIPSFSAVGSAIAAVFAEVVVLGYQLTKVKREIPLRRYLLIAAKFLPIGTVMFVIQLIIPTMENAWTELGLRLAVGSLVYVPIAAALVKRCLDE